MTLAEFYTIPNFASKKNRSQESNPLLYPFTPDFYINQFLL